VGPAGRAGADPRGLAVGGAVTVAYLERLARRSAAAGTVLCVGIDPTPEMLPDGWQGGLAGIERLGRILVEAAASVAAAIKPNLAFFEAHGSAGIAALERILASRPPDVLLVADAKRGDVETTTARQAVALYDALGADAQARPGRRGRQRRRRVSKGRRPARNPRGAAPDPGRPGRLWPLPDLNRRCVG